MERLDGFRLAYLGSPSLDVLRTFKMLGAECERVGPGTSIPLDASLLDRFDALWASDEPPGRFDEADVIDFLRKWDGERKPLVAVGDSVRRWLRAAAPRHLLVTGPGDVRELVEQAGQRFIDKPAVRDANVVSARSAYEAAFAVECAVELFDEFRRSGECAPREAGSKPLGGPTAGPGAAHPGLDIGD